MQPTPTEHVLTPERAATLLGLAGIAIVILRKVWQWAKLRIIGPPIEEALRYTLKPDLQKIAIAAEEARKAADALVRVSLDVQGAQGEIRELCDRLDDLEAQVTVLGRIVDRWLVPIEQRQGPKDRRSKPEQPQIPERRRIHRRKDDE